MNTNNELNLANVLNKRIIYDITPFTLLDYPHKTACILWFTGCNMRCSYCYNPDIVFGKGKKTIGEALQFIQSRIGLLDGVVLSGGECTLHKQVFELAIELKKMGLLVKIDTNGSTPIFLEKLIQNNLVDFISLDFKALPNKFQAITQSNLFSAFEASLLLFQQYKIPFEIRTTVHSNLLNVEDIQAMIAYLEKMEYKGIFYIQNYLNNVKTIGNLANTSNKITENIFSKTNIPIQIRN